MRRWSAFVPVAAVLALLTFVPEHRPRAHDVTRGRIYALETAALKAIQTLNCAQFQYRSQFDRYAGTLEELGPRGADLIAADLASGHKTGYEFTLAATPAGYTIMAMPARFGSTGSRTFYSDQSLAVREAGSRNIHR